MGLDIVELVMEIEEEFAIRIADDEAAHLTTVGLLHSFILEKQGRIPHDHCPTSRVFYQLRRVLIEEFGIPRPRIVPSTRVECLLPPEKRAVYWRRLGESLGDWQLPPLERPEWMTLLTRSATVGMLTAFVATIGLVALKQSAALWALGVWVYCAALALLLSRLSRRFAVEVPAACRSVRGCVETLLRWNYHHLVAPRGPLPRDDVWDRLCLVIGGNLGVDPKKLTSNTRFVEDLGAE